MSGVNRYAESISRARRFAGWTQQGVADALGINVQTIKRAEDPEYASDPKLLTRIGIAHVLGVPLDYLEGKIDDLESAEGEIARRVSEQASQIRELQQEIADLGEDMLRQLELAEGRLRAELREAVGGSPSDPGGGGPP